MKSVNIDGRRVGREAPCYLVAEIGINHNGDLGLARSMIDAASEAGADAVKFQNYRTEDFLSDRKLTYSYLSQGKQVTEAQYDMFKRCELRPGDLTQLSAHCRLRKIGFHSTPTSVSGIADLVALGIGVLKNGSDYLTHLPLIRAMGSTSLPTVLSTGMATLAEIDDAVRAFRETGNDNLILLHCTSSYPTPPQDLNLRRIPSLAATFDCTVGLSDHSVGPVAAIASVVLGARWIEKHFTLSRDLPGPDHGFSSDPAEFRTLVNSVRFAEQALGSTAPGPTNGEMKGRDAFRLSCVVNHDLEPGSKIREADIAFRRPGTGLAPKFADLLVGRIVRERLSAGDVIHLENLQ